MAVDDIEDLRVADLTIICVNDEAITDIVEFLDKKSRVVHTSGSVSIDVFKDFEDFGILYPLQTFSKNRTIDLSTIPWLIEASNQDFLEDLKGFCHDSFKANPVEASSKDRKIIHLAAVFASNYTTQMIRESEKILEKNSMRLDLLKPLILESIGKSLDMGPSNALTGPAKRNDLQVLQAHIEMIDDTELQQLYKLLAERIKSTV